MTTPKNEAIVGNLIDFSPTEEKLAVPVTVCEISEDKQGGPYEDNDVTRETFSPSGSEPKHYSRLCGYLNKLGNQKILKTFRKRWFVFNESNCKLYYYRSPHEQIPLGEIDISQATFSFDVTDKERSGLFSISVPGRDYFLEANNRQTCLFWLQELQKYRRANSLFRTKLMSDESSSVNDLTGRPQSGLLAQISPEGSPDNDDKKDVSLMQPIDCPADAIGEDSASGSLNALSNAHQKLNLIYNQIKTSTSFSKYDKSPLNSSPSPSNSESPVSQENTHIPVRPTRSGSASHPKTKYQNLKVKLSFRKGHSNEEKAMDETDNTLGKENCSQCSFV